MSAFDQYHAWEETGDVVHVLIIDRGDGSAENRLTLTDRPYYDKGIIVDGSRVKYHDTYPAPIYCISGESDIVTDGSDDGASIGDIVLLNADGRFDNILNEASISEVRFTMLRGDPAWSLLETSFPNMFMTIFRGQVQSVSMEHGKVRLKFLPIKYALDAPIANAENPLTLGTVFNMPVTLVDSALLHYRFSAGFELGQGLLSAIVMDNGAELNRSASPTPDYSLVLEDGDWKGLIQLATAPSGELTGIYKDISLKNSFELAEEVLSELGGIGPHDFVDGTLDHFAGIGIPVSVSDLTCHYITPDGAKYFLFSELSGTASSVYQCSLGSDDLINSLTYDSVSKDLTGHGVIYAVAFSDDGLVMVSSTDTSALGSKLVRWVMPSAYDIANLTFDREIGTIDIRASCLRFTEDGSGIVVCTRARFNLYELDEPYGLPISFSTPDISMVPNRAFQSGSDGPVIASRLLSAHIAENGTDVFMIHANQSKLKKFRLFDNLDLRGYVYQKEDISLPSADSLNGPSLLVHPSGNRFYFIGAGGSLLYQCSLASPFEVPFAVLDHVSIYPPDTYTSGIYADSSQSLGSIVSDILTPPNGGKFFIDNLGVISAVVAASPDASWTGTSRPSPTFHTLDVGDLIGDMSTAVKMTEVIPATTHYVIEYAKNFRPLGGSIASSVTENFPDFAEALRRDHFELVADIAIPDGREKNARLFSTNWIGLSTSSTKATPFDSQPADVMDDYQETWGVDRYMHEINCTLRCTPLSSNCYLGDIFTLNFDAPGISAGDKTQLLGRRVNWSRNEQTLTVMK